MSLLPSNVSGAVRDFQVGSQGVGKGLTDIVTGPFDLAAGAQNLLVSGINKALGTNIPMATPASKLVEKAVDASGLPLIDPATMSRSEKLAYDIRHPTDGDSRQVESMHLTPLNSSPGRARAAFLPGKHPEPARIG